MKCWRVSASKYALPDRLRSRPTLKLPGEIVFDEHTIVQVVPRLPGIITAVYRHHGQHVEKGEVLAVIESQVLAEMRSTILRSAETSGLGAHHL